MLPRRSEHAFVERPGNELSDTESNPEDSNRHALSAHRARILDLGRQAQQEGGSGAGAPYTRGPESLGKEKRCRGSPASTRR